MSSDVETKTLFPDTREEIAQLLEYDFRKLNYLLYGLPEEKRYKEFSIPKRDGSMRQISAPDSAIKVIQQRLSEYLYTHYTVKGCAHGFVKERDIVTNAKPHLRRRWVVNLDLKDFFPTINFGRVRGAFMAHPFHASEEAATLLAQICCHKGALPQGAPTSPIVSNIICRQLDNRMLDFARKHRLCYTRYADDITFSTNLKEIPADLGSISDEGTFLLGEEVRKSIEDCGFQVNDTKLHGSSRHHRQEVTGLIVNARVNVPRRYIKQIRCMLHAYERFGLSPAAAEHFRKYDFRKVDYPELTFRKILAGKIGYLGHVRGKQDDLYRRLAARLKALDPSAPLTIPLYSGNERIIVYGEGKTDTMHLQAAFESFKKAGEYTDLDIKFYRYRDDDEVNNEKLYKLCSTRPLQKHDDKIEIYLFDRDVKSYIPNVTTTGEEPRAWGQFVYSMVLPKVAHRPFENLCIEHFYQDVDLLKDDGKGHRIYLSSEFDPETGRHRTEDVSYRNRNLLKSNYPRILDQDVYNAGGGNVALSKMSFANSVLKKKGKFATMDFSAFAGVFDEIRKIVSSCMKID